MPRLQTRAPMAAIAAVSRCVPQQIVAAMPLMKASPTTKITDATLVGAATVVDDQDVALV